MLDTSERARRGLTPFFLLTLLACGASPETNSWSAQESGGAVSGGDVSGGEMAPSEPMADMDDSYAPAPTGYAESESVRRDPSSRQTASPSVQTVNAPGGGDGAGEDAGGAQAQAPEAQSWRRVSNQSRFATVSLGGGATLELRKVRVDVQVEGLRARTIVDHIFYNPHARTIEGTFRYPLPPEASISSYAMFLGSGTGTSPQQAPDFFGSQRQLQEQQQGFDQRIASIDPQNWGELRIGRIVKAERGREVYENVTRRQVDPALVEEVAPNTFEARVFPIQANGFHRVIVSYEQTLPRVGAELEYLFPLPNGTVESFDIDVRADARLTPRARYTGDVAEVASRTAHGSHHFSHRLAGSVQGGTYAFRFRAPAGPVEVLSGVHPERDERHFVARLHGDAQIPAAGGDTSAEHAVFLVDTSLSENADRFNIDVALLQQILERSPRIQRFNVITFDAGARWLSQRWMSNDEDGREGALDALREILLEGATDLGAALDALTHPPMRNARNTALDVFLLTDGALSWGERDVDTLIRRHQAASPWRSRFFAYRTGLGAENADLMRRLTSGDGAVFNCLSTASVPTCATAHHAAGFQIEELTVVGVGSAPAATHDVLVAGGAATLTRGGELLIAGKLTRGGTAEIRIRGKVGGETRTLRYPVTLQPQGTLASRAWAEIAIAHLLSTHDEDLESYAVALSQHYRVPSRATSFLVLETDAEYEQYSLENEQRQHPGSVGELARGIQQQRQSARTSWERLARAMRTAQEHHRLDDSVWSALSGIASTRPIDFVRGRQDIPAVRPGDTPRGYRRSMDTNPEHAEHYRAEGERRRAQGELGAAIRAVSSAVENAPSDAEIARLVGYTLSSWGARAEAAELFFGVLEKRPYEPQSYRDLATVLWTRRPSLTAMLYEAVLAGNWDGRFRGVVDIVREEYALFTRAWQRQAPRSPLAAFLADRQQALSLTVPEVDLRVTMTWNTDNTDIDLWVTDPRGDECYYGNRNIPSGGELLADVTQGFGPERFQARDAEEGVYTVRAKYYGNNGNRLLALTYVTLTVATHVGSAQEQVRHYVVPLRDRGDEAVVARIDMD